MPGAHEIYYILVALGRDRGRVRRHVSYNVNGKVVLVRHGDHDMQKEGRIKLKIIMRRMVSRAKHYIKKAP